MRQARILGAPARLMLCLLALAQVAGEAAEAAEPGKNAVSGEVGRLEDVVVTGQKDTRRIYDDGASIEIVTKEDLKTKGDLINLTELQQRTPNILDTGLGNDLPSIRGVEGSATGGAMSFFTGARPRASLQLDGRASNYNELAFGTKSLWDVKQVEIYRGPQSYVQGRNAMSGSVIMTTNDPAPKFGGALKLDAGNHERYQAAAMLTGPIIKDQLLFRVAIDKQHRKSPEDLATYEPAGDSSIYDALTVRTKLAFSPLALPDFYTKLTHSYITSRAPQGEFRSNNQVDRERAVFKIKTNSTIWDAAYRFNDHWKLENKVAYTSYKHDRFAPKMGGPAYVKGDEIQVEPILRFNYDKVRGMLGFFYFKADQDETVFLKVSNDYKDKSETKALFAGVTITPAKYLEIDLSARWEQEVHDRRGGKIFPVNYKIDESNILPKVDVAWVISDRQRLGAKVGRGYNPGGAGITFQPPIETYEYRSEYVWNYEIYHRWMSMDRRLGIRTNLFYNDYKDMQINYVSAKGSSLLGNAEKAVTYGAEVNVDWRPVDNARVYAGLGLLGSEIKEYKVSSYKGNKLARAPGVTFSAGASWTFRNGVEIGGDYKYVGEHYSDVANTAARKIKGYGQANLHAAWNMKWGTITGYVDNVFNSGKGILDMGGNRITYQAPRQIGASVQLRF